MSWQPYVLRRTLVQTRAADLFYGTSSKVWPCTAQNLHPKAIPNLTTRSLTTLRSNLLYEPKRTVNLNPNEPCTRANSKRFNRGAQ